MCWGGVSSTHPFPFPGRGTRQIQLKKLVVVVVEEAVLDSKRRKLWLTVVKQAVEEAEGRFAVGTEEEEKPRLQEEARDYLSVLSEGLLRATSLAGMTGEQGKLLVQINREKYVVNG